MKKLITILALTLFSVAAYAQATNLNIINRTSCQICFDISGNDGTGGCTPALSNTATICIPPFGFVSYPNTSLAPFTPSLPTTGFFIGLCWLNRDPTVCPTIPLQVRCIIDPCAGPIQSDFLAMYNGCASCGTVTATWATIGGVTTVTFN